MTTQPKDRCPLCGEELTRVVIIAGDRLRCYTDDCPLQYILLIPEACIGILHQLALIEDAHRTELAAVKAERDARYTEQEMDEACALGLSWQRGDPRRKSGFAHEFFAMQDRVKESRKLKTALDAERGKR